MLTQLEVFSSNSDLSFAVPLESTIETDPIFIKNIDGLGPVAASISTSDLANIDGGMFQGSSVGTRNIVLTYGFNPSLGLGQKTISQLRNVLYSTFMPKTKVRLVFQVDHNDLLNVEIDGYVETCEPNIFSKDPDVQVSILCPSPHFRFTEETVVSGITDWYGYDLSTLIVNGGSVDSGGVLTLTSEPYSAVPSEPLRLINTHNGVKEIFYMDSLIITEDEVLKISSEPRNKFAYFEKSLLKRSALSQVSTTSKWVTIRPGENYLGVHWVGGREWEFRYTQKFGGL